MGTVLTKVIICAWVLTYKQNIYTHTMWKTAVRPSCKLCICHVIRGLSLSLSSSPSHFYSPFLALSNTPCSSLPSYAPTFASPTACPHLHPVGQCDLDAAGGGQQGLEFHLHMPEKCQFLKPRRRQTTITGMCCTIFTEQTMRLPQ